MVWTNIDNRKYNTSKVIEDMKLFEYHEKPWDPHFTGSLPDDFYSHVKTMWDEDDDTKKKWNKCKNRSNIIIEDDKINTILNDISLGYID